MLSLFGDRVVDASSARAVRGLRDETARQSDSSRLYAGVDVPSGRTWVSSL
jgi:hypothetical protein